MHVWINIPSCALLNVLSQKHDAVKAKCGLGPAFSGWCWHFPVSYCGGSIYYSLHFWWLGHIHLLVTVQQPRWPCLSVPFIKSQDRECWNTRSESDALSTELGFGDTDWELLAGKGVLPSPTCRNGELNPELFACKASALSYGPLRTGAFCATTLLLGFPYVHQLCILIPFPWLLLPTCWQRDGRSMRLPIWRQSGGCIQHGIQH